MNIVGFVGLDPAGVALLATGTSEAAEAMTRVSRRLGGVLDRNPDGEPIRGIALQLRQTAEQLTGYVAAMRRRSEIMMADPGIETEETGLCDARPSGGLDAAALGRLSPEAVAAAFASAAPLDGERLARSFPDLIGALDGAPPQLRYLANRTLIRRQIRVLQQLLAEFAPPAPNGWGRPLRPTSLLWHPVPRLEAVAAERVEQQIDRYERWLSEDRQILLFDPAGDGRVVEVFGDLDVARHVAVVVPGMANDLENFDGGEGLRESSVRLYAEVAGLDTQGAVVAWMGYDAPDGADAALRSAARDAAPGLQHFVRGLDPSESRHLTVIAHSYGSLVAGIAAAESLPVDDLVVVGSPGMSLESVAAARLRAGGGVWVALAEADPIVAGISPAELPPWWLPPGLGPLWFAADMRNGPEMLWHGVNPATDAFGAVRVSTGGSSGHSEYFEGESLDNLARIVVGRYGEVELVD